MLKKFYPYEYVESVFSIDYQKVYDKGYKAIIFDIDNTLVPHGNDSTEEIDELFSKIHNIGLKTLLLSNNSKERIERFKKNIDTIYISEADKPKVDGFLKALDKLKLNKEEVLYIGDQVFTDIYGANKVGIDSILVKFIGYYTEKNIGKKRRLEKLILKRYSKNKKYNHRLKDIIKEDLNTNKKRKKLFCELSPTCYKISMQKEICKRHIRNLSSHIKFSNEIDNDRLPNLVTEYKSKLIKKSKGMNLRLQNNKVVNIKIACRKINGMVIHPGEVFSFWKVVGKPTRKKGYKDGRIITKNKIEPGLGGGLCNLGNTIHRMVLHSPLDVIEFHKHSDALAPDSKKRVPFSTGTSISYNHIDYRFKNNTEQDIQILVWCEKGMLCGEIRSEKEFPWSYKLIEENHHFKKEGQKYYRNSKIYREISLKETGEVINRELVLDNHSEVMYDYDLIPKELITE